MADYSGLKKHIRDFFRSDGGVELTGTVRDRDENPEQETRRMRRPQNRPNVGWVKAKGLGHMCLPPDQYEDGWGPGSLYICPECGCPWQAVGIRNVSDSYRWLGYGAQMRFGPKQYLFAGDHGSQYRDSEGNGVCPIATQQGFYDWRDPGEVMCQQLDRLSVLVKNIEMAAASWLEAAQQPKYVQFTDQSQPVVATKEPQIDWSIYNPAPGGVGPYGRHSIPSDGADADREGGA